MYDEKSTSLALPLWSTAFSFLAQCRHYYWVINLELSKNQKLIKSCAFPFCHKITIITWLQFQSLDIRPWWWRTRSCSSSCWGKLRPQLAWEGSLVHYWSGRNTSLLPTNHTRLSDLVFQRHCQLTLSSFVIITGTVMSIFWLFELSPEMYLKSFMNPPRPDLLHTHHLLG